MMKAAVLKEPGRFAIESKPVPIPDHGEVVIKVHRVGICGTDVHIFNGHYAAENLPMVPGHEFSGTVHTVGANVTRLRKSQNVVVDINIGCGTCFWCRRNEILNCPEMNQLGITMDAAFCEFIAVPQRLVIPAPAHIPHDVLALTEPLACVVRAARKAQAFFGQSAVVLGAGPVGNLHVQFLRAIGAAPIIVSDISKQRVEMALAAGADFGVSDADKLKETVLKATQGRGADLVIESVGIQALYEQAMSLLRKGGHIAAFGVTGPDEQLPIGILKLILEENSIKGSVAGMGQDMHHALTMLVHGRIDTAPFTSSVFDLDDIQTAFETLRDRPGDLKTQIQL
ncbi:MAG: alcohol dehydrogenase catalytic domain-containing protein [Hyphomicrobiales bacterium]